MSSIETIRKTKSEHIYYWKTKSEHVYKWQHKKLSSAGRHNTQYTFLAFLAAKTQLNKS